MGEGIIAGQENVEGTKFSVGDRLRYKREGHRPAKPQPGDEGVVVEVHPTGAYGAPGVHYLVQFDRAEVGEWLCRKSSFEEDKLT